MLAYTHITLNLTLAYIVAQDVFASPVLLFAFIIGSLLPDIDHAHSVLGKHFFVWRLTEHRGILHSIWPIIGLSMLSLNLSYQFIYWPIYLTAGYVLHILADALTKQGILYVYPLPFRIAGPFKTGGVMEHILLLCCLAILSFGILAQLS